MSIFDAAYDGTPPWDIGRPQAAFVRLAESGRIEGRVLDVGCGTGENAIYLATRGLEVWALDASAKAIERAASKAKSRGTGLHLVVGDAMELRRLKRSFDTILDCGLFHTFSDDGRRRYLTSLESVIARGGTLHVLCFSDREPGTAGPRRIREDELRRTFTGGWWIDSITRSHFETLRETGNAEAWLVTVTYEGKPIPGIH